MKIIHSLKLIAGFLALVMGAIGLFLPVWPTTPFVLLAVACFSGSPKLRAKLLNIRFFREYYESYRNGYGIPKKTVRFSLIFLWSFLLLSCFLVHSGWATFGLFGVGIAVTIHIYCISKPRTKQQKQ